MSIRESIVIKNKENFLYYLFILWIILIPFVRWGGMYEGAKVIWFLSGSLVLVTSWLLNYAKIPSCNKVDGLFLLWVGVLLVSSVFGIHPLESILGGSYRHQGVLFFFSLWVVGKTVDLLSVQLKSFLILGLGVSVLGQSVLLIGQSLESSAMRLSGSFGEPNAAAGFLAIGFYFVWVASKKHAHALLIRFFSLLVVGIGIVLTGSRTGILSFMIYCGFAWGSLTRATHFIIVFFIIGIVAWFTFSVQRPASPFEDRGTFWYLGSKAFLERPILGYGAESGATIFREAFSKWKEISLQDLLVDRAHNLWIDVLLWSGFVGFSVFCSWFFVVFKKLFNNKNTGKIIALIIWCVFATFQPLGVVHWILLMLLLQK